jgi:hypothetical protein
LLLLALLVLRLTRRPGRIDRLGGHVAKHRINQTARRQFESTV